MRANPFSTLTDELTPTLSPALVPESPGAAPGATASPGPDADYDELVAFHGIERERLVLIHPGSHRSAPAWPAERYADVADQLTADGWQIAIVGDAPNPERTASVLGAMQTAALFLASAVAPHTLPRLIADARLLLSRRCRVALARRQGARSARRISCSTNTRSEAIIDRARAELSDQGRAHRGRPFTLHMPAEHDAV